MTMGIYDKLFSFTWRKRHSKNTDEIHENKNFTVGFDNYFTSLRLLCILRQKGINAVGRKFNKMMTLAIQKNAKQKYC